MNWMICMLAAVAVAAFGLALYERRNNRRMRFDDPADPTRDPANAAYTRAEAIRAEAAVAHPPHAGGMF